MARIVFDIGGSNTRVAVARERAVIRIKKRRTPSDPKAAADQLAEMAKSIAGDEPIESAAGGIPGVVGADGRVTVVTSLSAWHGFPFQKEIEERLGVRVHTENDAAIAGLGEAVYGAGRGYSIVAYICIGTGVGGARIVGEHIDERAHGFEPGLQIISANFSATLEDIVSGKAIRNRFHIDAKDLERAHYDALTPILAVGLSNSIVFWSPDILVLGGSLMNEKNGYRIEAVQRALERVCPVREAMPEIRKALLGDNSGLYGALALLDNQ